MASILVASAAVAHEFWIQPDTFRPAVGAPTSIRILVGDGFPGERRLRDSKKLERLDLIGPDRPDKPRPIEGKNGDDPVGTVTLVKPGVHAIVYRGRETTIVLDAEKFESYLREDGLDEASRRRAELGESGVPGREAYSRCAKALVCAGSEAGGAWDVRAGLTLEIVPVSNPYRAVAGNRLSFQLLEDGKPVAGALMAALTSVDGQSLRLTARTSGDGTASFELHSPGLWLINAVRMKRAEGRDDVDWVSVWSSLTFELATGSSAGDSGH